MLFEVRSGVVSLLLNPARVHMLTCDLGRLSHGKQIIYVSMQKIRLLGLERCASVSGAG